MASNIADLLPRIGELKRKVIQILPHVREDINRIISNRVQSTSEIERVLDTLLDYLPLGIGEQEFKLLNGYYATLNRQNAEIYDSYRRRGSS